MKKPSKRLFLKGSKIRGFHEAFHFCVENFIFFKWTFFKNRPRSSFLLTRSLLINTLVYGAYYTLFSHLKFLVMGIDIDPVLLFTGSTALGYWAMSRDFHQRSQYLSSLYNEVIKAEAKGNEREALMLKLSFSSQLLTMDLWGHRLYSWVLADAIEEAYSWNAKSETPLPSDFIDKLNSGKLSSGEVRNLLIQRLQVLSKSPASVDQRQHLKVVS